MVKCPFKWLLVISNDRKSKGHGLNQLVCCVSEAPFHSGIKSSDLNSSTNCSDLRQEKKDRVIFLFEQELSEVAIFFLSLIDHLVGLNLLEPPNFQLESLKAWLESWITMNPLSRLPRYPRYGRFFVETKLT